MAANKPMSVKLDPDTRHRIEQLAKSRRRTSHWMMREAIQQFLEREEKREAFLQDGIRAWNEYQGTGLHATFEEADSWLAKLEEGGNVEPPQCHD
jgi:predicted transcriptional regulator